jgi:hypothetical protein
VRTACAITPDRQEPESVAPLNANFYGSESTDDEVVISPEMKDLKDAKWRLAFSSSVQAQMNSFDWNSNFTR